VPVFEALTGNFVSALDRAGQAADTRPEADRVLVGVEAVVSIEIAGEVEVAAGMGVDGSFPVGVALNVGSHG